MNPLNVLLISGWEHTVFGLCCNSPEIMFTVMEMSLDTKACSEINWIIYTGGFQERETERVITRPSEGLMLVR